MSKRAPRTAKRPLRILFVNDSQYEEGGAQVYLAWLCDALQQRGHQTLILASDERKQTKARRFAQKTFAAVDYVRFSRLWKRFRNPAAVQSIQETCAVWKPDLVQYNYTTHHVSVAGLRATTLPRTAFLHDIVLINPSLYGRTHGVLYTLYSWLLTQRSRAALRSLDAVIAPSAFVARVARDAHIKNVRVITHGVAVHDSTPVRKTNNLLFVGGLDEGKGVHHLLAAFATVRKQHPRATLTIVGDGPARKALEAQARTLGIAARVRFAGFARGQALAQYYQAAQMVFVPSITQDAFALVKLEAMMHGRPVVVSSAGGVAEGVEHGRSGFVIAPGDERALARSANTLLTDFARCKAMGRAAAKRARKYSFDAHVAQCEALYAELTRERAS